MLKIFLQATILISLINTLDLPSNAEVIHEYDEFSGKTKVLVIPSNWDGKTPRLFLDKSFGGKNPTEIPKSLGFSVIVPLRQYMKCVQGVSGVIADGERVATSFEGETVLSRPKIQPMPRKDPKWLGYAQLWEIYPIESFKKIVAATEVKYQLCGDNNEIYSLSPEEQADLKKFAEIVIP